MDNTLVLFTKEMQNKLSPRLPTGISKLMSNTVPTLKAGEEQAQQQATQTTQELWCSWLSS